jgi:hypothetical protein
MGHHGVDVLPVRGVAFESRVGIVEIPVLVAVGRIDVSGRAPGAGDLAVGLDLLKLASSTLTVNGSPDRFTDTLV